MKYSIVCQSFLGHYDGAAKNRPEKLKRAIKSVLDQSLNDFELIIVADGCNETFDLVQKEYESDGRIECFLIPKQKLWSGTPRSFGIKQAKGDYVLYIDSDDYWGKDHLKKIDNQIGDTDWVYFNDILAPNKKERTVFINRKFQCGTANICHKRTLDITWGGGKYGYDDWSAVESLLRFKNNKRIDTPEYYCAHIPRRFDV